MHMTDDRIIQQYFGLQVQAQQDTVVLKDHSRVTLHPVCAHGQRQMFLRALHADGLRWVVFDLRHLTPGIEDDVLRLHRHDTPGVVMYTLRQHFANAQAVLAAADKHRVASWWQHETCAAGQAA